MENNNQNKIKEAILSEIKKGKIFMRPRWHFVLKAVLGAISLALVFLVLLSFSSFLAYSLHTSGVIFAPTMGPKGIGIFFRSLPWLLILGTLLFMFILELMVRKYSFTYKKPLLYSVLSILVLSSVISFWVSNSGFHDRFYEFAHRRGLPIVDPLYRNFAHPPFGEVHPGVIIIKTENGFTLKIHNEEELEILVSPDTRLSPGLVIEEDEEVVVFGRRVLNTVKAVGVRRIGEVRVK